MPDDDAAKNPPGAGKIGRNFEGRQAFAQPMLTATTLRVLLADMLTGEAGGAWGYWHDLIGEVAVLPIATNPACNWKIEPAGTRGQLAAIGEAVHRVRQELPHALRG